ncbi:MAG TPA: potassium transporter TrkG [Pseudoflavonifractor sp.]|nr:potassium transporter TrkG [Pseudoflavonifractor sp.]
MGKALGHLMRDLLIRRKSMNATRILAGGFAAIILIGAFLLTLPISSRAGEFTNFMDSLFTATSATCVTGLVRVDTWLHWSFFGQAVIITLIQMGGLGFMTVIALVSLLLHRRIGLSERLIMASTFNLSDMDGVVRVVRHALYGTFLIEGIGAALLSIRFIPEFGLASGIWRSVFHAVSAFCNAGFDLTGGKYGPFTSLEGYNHDPLILCTIMALIVIGGLGFYVWEDFLRAKGWKDLSLYSKMVLTITASLIVGGALFFFAVEYGNPGTLGGMPIWQKILNSFFQSITLRTAGFASLNQGALRESSLVMSCMLMLIGGSSGSCAGGMKTVTAATLLLGLQAGLKGREEVTFRRRTISYHKVLSAMTLALMMVALFLVGAMLISLIEGVPYLSAAFETASGLATVGNSVGITPFLSTPSMLILISLMYVGRVGVFTFSVALLARSRQNAKIKYPNLEVLIG